MSLSRFLPDAEAKADRIDYTRSNVRNGPLRKNHRPLDSRFHTAGQERRAFRRADKVATERQNRKARKDWIRANKDLSRLRGQLEVVSRPGSPLYEAAMRGLFAGYGAVVQPELVDPANTEELLPLDFYSADHRALVVSAAVHHYTLATGGQEVSA